MYENTDDVYVKYAQVSDITITDEMRIREGAQTARVPRSDSPSVIGIILALIEVSLLIGAAVVIWTCNLVVASDGFMGPLTVDVTESFTLFGNFGYIVDYFIGFFGKIGQSFSNVTALIALLESVPELLFCLGVVLTAVVLPALAMVSFIITLFTIGRRPINFPRSFAALTALCLCDMLLMAFAGMKGISISSGMVVCVLIGLCGIAVTFLMRITHGIVFSCRRLLGGAGLIGGCALAFCAFPIKITEGTTALSALLSAISEPTALSVALTVAAALCTVFSIITLPIFIYRVVVRCTGGKGRIVGHSVSFLITSLLTSFVIGAYAYLLLPSANLQSSVYLYAASGVICFVSALMLGSPSKK